MNTGKSLKVLTAAIVGATLSTTSLPVAAASTAAMEKQIQALQDQLPAIVKEPDFPKTVEPIPKGLDTAHSVDHDSSKKVLVINKSLYPRDRAGAARS